MPGPSIKWQRRPMRHCLLLWEKTLSFRHQFHQESTLYSSAPSHIYLYGGILAVITEERRRYLLLVPPSCLALLWVWKIECGGECKVSWWEKHGLPTTAAAAGKSCLLQQPEKQPPTLLNFTHIFQMSCFHWNTSLWKKSSIYSTFKAHIGYIAPN